MQLKSAFEVATENSRFLVDLATAMDKLPQKERMAFRQMIIEHNQKNLSVMDQAVRAKMRRFS